MRIVPGPLQKRYGTEGGILKKIQLQPLERPGAANRDTSARALETLPGTEGKRGALPIKNISALFYKDKEGLSLSTGRAPLKCSTKIICCFTARKGNGKGI